ncbi:Uncharacterized protein HZ326_28902 [Fusarium oxysporum f. sp. albedinis]|nr:Uncharacterized protein HZ326_28902 [Fusarium oxysporum f. sp. albedinis]
MEIRTFLISIEIQCIRRLPSLYERLEVLNDFHLGLSRTQVLEGTSRRYKVSVVLRLRQNQEIYTIHLKI